MDFIIFVVGVAVVCLAVAFWPLVSVRLNAAKTELSEIKNRAKRRLQNIVKPEEKK